MGAFLGAVVGGAVAGALISTVSYAVLSGLKGETITSQGLIDAAISGAISGAIGGAIGTISVGAKALSVVQKAIPFVSEKILTIGTKTVASLPWELF